MRRAKASMPSSRSAPRTGSSFLSPGLVAQDLARRVVARHAGDPATRVRTAAAEIDALERHAVIAISQYRAGAEELVQRELAVEDVAAHEPQLALEIERRQQSARDH